MVAIVRKPREVILGKGDDPYAVRTLLGWGILDPVSLTQDDVSTDIDVTCNRIITRKIGYTRILNDRFGVPMKAREVLNPGQVNGMFNLDFSEVNSKEHPLSQEERRFMEKAKQGNPLCPDGHYDMPLPLKNAEVVLPNNRELALRRLIPLKKRSSSCRSYQDQYTAFMDSMFKNGYAEKVSMPDPADGLKINSRVWYIPHHSFLHPKKPSKIWMVFDFSAVFKEESLNKPSSRTGSNQQLVWSIMQISPRKRRVHVRHRNYVLSGQGNGRLQGHASFPLVGE